MESPSVLQGKDPRVWALLYNFGCEVLSCVRKAALQYRSPKPSSPSRARQKNGCTVPTSTNTHKKFIPKLLDGEEPPVSVMLRTFEEYHSLSIRCKHEAALTLVQQMAIATSGDDYTYDLECTDNPKRDRAMCAAAAAAVPLLIYALGCKHYGATSWGTRVCSWGVCQRRSRQIPSAYALCGVLTSRRLFGRNFKRPRRWPD